MTIDEKWDKVKEYYESTGYRHPKTGVRIKFRQRLTNEQIEMLWTKMHMLTKEMEATPDKNMKKFANVVKLLRNQDLGNL